MSQNILVNTISHNGEPITVSISIRKKLKRLIKESLQRNTKLTTNQFLIEEFKYHEQVNHGQHSADSKTHNAFYINVEDVADEQGWSEKDKRDIARDIKLYILEYAHDNDTTIRFDCFVERPLEEIIVIY